MTYHPLVFTLPHELNGWMQLHPDEIYALLFKIVWRTLKAFDADKKRLNGQLGMTAVLHTWGQNLSQHVHLHCLVPGGTLGSDHQWHAAKSNYLFPVKAFSRHYRGNMVSLPRECINEGKLNRVTNPGEVDKMLNILMQKNWVVYTKHCLNHANSVVGYLARYTHRIAISNQRFTSNTQNDIEFSYKDYRDNQMKSMALHPSEFIRRFLMHILPKGLMRILANRCRKTSLKIIRQRLATPAPEKPIEDSHESGAYPCPTCKKGQLILKHKIKPILPWTQPQPS